MHEMKISEKEIRSKLNRLWVVLHRKISALGAGCHRVILLKIDYDSSNNIVLIRHSNIFISNGNL